MGGSTAYCQNANEWYENTGDDIKVDSSKLERNYLSTSVLDNNFLAKGDSGATSHYIWIEDTHTFLDNIQT